ncbi:MAG TPA: helix-turn-helix transcriptional regulator [Chromatiales bacterium]|nr:helix-turn-helix transcriptional regulator [Thiotrichales bacterium]HIP69399.1 helix-turn-helix transcriptional regulator [Chromatiales bacterium]
MEIEPTRFRDTLHKIPFAEDSWNDLISLIKISTDSQAGIMMITRDQDHDILNSHSPDFVMSQEVRCAFEESEWITAALPEKWSKEYLSKGVVLGTDIVPQKSMRETPFYQEVLTSLGLEYLMAGVSLFGEDYRTLLKFFRATKQENFSNDEATELGTLMPEIRQMMRFTERLYERMVLETAESKAGAPRGAATIIINTKGEVVHANQVAESLLSEGKILDAKQNHLYAVDDLDSKALSKMMAQALGNTGTPVQDCALVGEGSDVGVHQLLALPVPLEEPPFPWMEALRVAAVVVIDPMRTVKIDPSILKTLYQITPAEIDLVNAMANGIKPVQYAAQANKSVPTVQTQRQAVFQKVGVSNQLELMTMLRDLTTSFEEATA